MPTMSRKPPTKEWSTPSIVEFSAVAGIIDNYGGFRVVVTEPWRMIHHVGRGEHLFIVPGLLVTEPIAWHDIPGLIKRAEAHIAEWFRGRNDPDMDLALLQYKLRNITSKSAGSIDSTALVWG